MEILLAYDNDKAGQEAAIRAWHLLQSDEPAYVKRRKEVEWVEEAEKARSSYRMILIKGWREGLVKDRSLTAFCRRQITEIEDTKIECRARLDESFRAKIEQEVKGNFYPEFFVNLWKRRVESLEKDLKRWQSLLAMYQGKREHVDYSQNIERVKEIPIPHVLGQDAKTRYGKLFISCPFHADKTPSMCWYQKNNKVKCYSCQFNGDPIDLFQKLHGCDFKTAVQSLIKYI